MRSTMRLEMASPRPVPPNLRVEEPSACSNSRKTRSWSSRLRPMPVSRTTKRMPSPGSSGSAMTATPPRSRELDGVAGEIEQHLAQPRRVADDVRRQAFVDQRGDLDALGLRARRQQFDHAFHQRAERERPRLQIEPAGLDLGEIENLLDQRQQRFARGLCRLGVGDLLGRELGVEQQVGHAEHAVERRADLVADHGEEARLGAVGGLRLVARRAQARARPRPGR